MDFTIDCLDISFVEAFKCLYYKLVIIIHKFVVMVIIIDIIVVMVIVIHIKVDFIMSIIRFVLLSPFLCFLFSLYFYFILIYKKK